MFCQNRLLSLYLVDTSTSRDVYINDALVQQGLALFVSDTLEDEMGTETYSLEGPLPGVSHGNFLGCLVQEYFCDPFH